MQFAGKNRTAKAAKSLAPTCRSGAGSLPQQSGACRANAPRNKNAPMPTVLLTWVHFYLAYVALPSILKRKGVTDRIHLPLRCCPSKRQRKEDPFRPKPPACHPFWTRMPGNSLRYAGLSVAGKDLLQHRIELFSPAHREIVVGAGQHYGLAMRVLPKQL